MNDFTTVFTNTAIIAEIKFASPSLGKIYYGDLDHIAIARSYLQNGADALSVLTKEKHFKGSMDFIREIRNEFPEARILCKDFILQKEQITQASNYGANAILLIVSFLTRDQLFELYDFTLSRGLTPLIEVHNHAELETALQLNPKVIGINNRNLQTFKIDLDVSRQLIDFIPDDIIAICESGIQNQNQIQEMQGLGFNGFLIGTQLMKHNDPGSALRSLLQGGDHAS